MSSSFEVSGRNPAALFRLPAAIWHAVRIRDRLLFA